MKVWFPPVFPVGLSFVVYYLHRVRYVLRSVSCLVSSRYQKWLHTFQWHLVKCLKFLIFLDLFIRHIGHTKIFMRFEFFDCIFPDNTNTGLVSLFMELSSYQILFSSINRHKLLIILQLSCCSKVSQLINRFAVLSNLPHDVAWLNVPVYHSIFSQVVHPLHWKREEKKGNNASVSKLNYWEIPRYTPTYTLQNCEELCFRQAKGIFWLLEQAEQTSSWTILHYQHVLFRGQLEREIRRWAALPSTLLTLWTY